jgi:hypothetical protein
MEIKHTGLVTSDDGAKFYKELNESIHSMQQQDLVVEYQFSSANVGNRLVLSALLVGRIK